jgi:hypothetical protein
MSRLPEVTGNKPDKGRFRAYPIGYFHIDIAEVRTEMGRLYLVVAIDRTSKFAYVELHEKVTTRVAGDFLRALIQAVPYRVHMVPTDHGVHFTTPSNTASPLRSASGPSARRVLPGSCLRVCLCAEQYRPQADQAQASLED